MFHLALFFLIIPLVRAQWPLEKCHLIHPQNVHYQLMSSYPWLRADTYLPLKHVDFPVFDVDLVSKVTQLVCVCHKHSKMFVAPNSMQTHPTYSCLSKPCSFWLKLILSPDKVVCNVYFKNSISNLRERKHSKRLKTNARLKIFAHERAMMRKWWGPMLEKSHLKRTLHSTIVICILLTGWRASGQALAAFKTTNIMAVSQVYKAFLLASLT